jgi:acetamidase/formamidase
MGLHEDLNMAAKMAVREMVEYLSEEKRIHSEYAYMIISLIVDLHVTQLVNGIKGIHAMLPKSIFEKELGE